EYLTRLVARLLSLHVDDVQIDQPLIEFGLDSLMAVELKIQIQTDLGVTISVAMLLDRLTIARLSSQILLLAELAGNAEQSIAAFQPWQPDENRDLDACATLSDDALAAHVDQLGESDVDSLLEKL